MAPLAQRAREAIALAQKLLFDPQYLAYAALICLLLEVPVNLLIIRYRAYTEIDWVAYMEEVRGAIDGEYDYSKLEGGTGPLVYPAGFVYVFGALYYACDNGENIVRGQYIFAALYLLMLGLVSYIYVRTKQCPPLVLFLMSFTSYRIHSVFVLRLFNDPVAMVFLYAAVVAALKDRWWLTCALYSVAVSIKMNILLFAPGLLVLLLARFGLVDTIPRLALCAAIQVVPAVPFLLTNPVAYVTRAFDFGRVFFYKWTVNWRLLQEEVFLDRRFHIALLALHLSAVVAFMAFRWARPFGGWKSLLSTERKGDRGPLYDRVIVTTLFASNFLGMVFSRSLHYQFYVWYYHTIPLLLWSARSPNWLRALVWVGLEFAWNTYPSTPFSSGLMHCAHACLLVGLWLQPEVGDRQTASGTRTKKRAKRE